MYMKYIKGLKMEMNKYMLYSVCLLAMLGQGRELMAQTEATGDSLVRQRKYEDAFDYLLQKPLKNETFSNKKLGDHLFLMGGVGLNWLNVDGASPSPQASLMMGDWLTPVHGVRVGAKAGWMHYGAGKNKYIGAELDYLLNLTALQQAGLAVEKTEFYCPGLTGPFYYVTVKNSGGKILASVVTGGE